MELNKLKVVELTTIENREIEGGLHPDIVAAAAYLIWETIGNPNASYTAFNNGFNDYK